MRADPSLLPSSKQLTFRELISWAWRGSMGMVYGRFRKWWYPQIIHFNRVFHYKPSILGYPYFWKHPYIYNLYQVLQVVTSIGPSRFCPENRAENVSSIWGINPGHFEEAGTWIYAKLVGKYTNGPYETLKPQELMSCLTKCCGSCASTAPPLAKKLCCKMLSKALQKVLFFLQIQLDGSFLRMRMFAKIYLTGVSALKNMRISQGIRPLLLHLLAVTIHFPYRLLRSLNTLVFSSVFGRLAKEHLSKRLEQTFGASWRICREEDIISMEFPGSLNMW